MRRSMLALDRERTAALLGFDGVIGNSRDAGVGTKDYVAEILASVAILMTNLPTLASDRYLWSSNELAMVELADGFCGTSSLTPQKKNPWAVDWLRGPAGNSIGYFASCLGAIRSSSSTDGSVQDYPETPLPLACLDACEYLDLMAGVFATITVKKETMLARARDSWARASNLAAVIARRADLSYRSAHAIVARLVRIAAERGDRPTEATGELLDVAGLALGLAQSEVREALDPEAFVATRVAEGRVNPREVEAMLALSRAGIRRDQNWLTERRRRLSSARSMLREAARGYALEMGG